MKHKIFTLFLALVASVTMINAEIIERVQIGDLYYNLDGTNKTAEVTYHLYNNPANYDGRTTVSIPEVVIYNEKTFSVTSIGKWAFANCTGLTSIEILNNVTSIEYAAFSGCTGLTYVIIPNSVTSIGSSAFSGCKGMTSLEIPNSVTNISSYAFSGCTGLTSIEIPNSVTSIGDYAFHNCVSLISIKIPNSVSSIGYQAFYNVPNIVYRGSATGSPWDAKSINGYIDSWFVYSDNTKTTLSACSAVASGGIAIPNSVTRIRERAFSGCTSLTSIEIPNGVTSIGNMAFAGCTGLTSIEIPNSVISIGNYAFDGCTGLTSIEIPNSVTTINMGAFNGCKGLTSIEISNNVTYIGEYAFQNCTSLTSIEIPNSVTSIRSGAFSGCTGLKSVYISDIAAWCEIKFSNYANPLAYSHNLYLKGELVAELVIPDNVTSINDYAFYSCTSLTSIEIPNSVTSIGNYAFSYCSSLRNIYSKRFTPPTISSNTLSNIHSQAIVHVPFGASNTYRNADYWKDMTIEGPRITFDVMNMATSCSISFNVENIEIASVGIKDGETFDGNILEYIGLEPNSEYKDIPVVLTSNTGETETVNVSFKTTALELTTQASVPVSENVAILLAETNMADIETSCGFEWKRNDMPDDYVGNKVFCPVANGTMAGRLKNLKDDVLYKYRAFYQSAAGNMYYGDWQYIFTGDVAVEFDPILYTYAAALIKEREATLKGYALAGSTDFTEQGFEYWAESRAPLPNAPRRLKSALGERHTVTATGISMRVSLSDLDPGTTYRYRTYAKIGDQVLYGSEMTFTTQGEFTYAIKFVNWDGEELQTLHVAENAVPEYTGETPVRPDDEQFTYTFSGWTPEITAATADATYTATFKATEIKPEALDQITNDQSTTAAKIFRDGQLYIIRGENVYTITGQTLR